MKNIIALAMSLVLLGLINDLMALDVSGYTVKGIYVRGDLDVDSSGDVDGYLCARQGRSIHVEGELEEFKKTMREPEKDTAVAPEPKEPPKEIASRTTMEMKRETASKETVEVKKENTVWGCP